LQYIDHISKEARAAMKIELKMARNEEGRTRVPMLPVTWIGPVVVADEPPAVVVEGVEDVEEPDRDVETGVDDALVLELGLGVEVFGGVVLTDSGVALFVAGAS